MKTNYVLSGVLCFILSLLFFILNSHDSYFNSIELLLLAYFFAIIGVLFLLTNSIIKEIHAIRNRNND